MLKIEAEMEEASECGSGCESGWTMYLGQSYESSASPLNKGDVQEEEEEDLSMVSDASSGPPHAHDDEDDYYSPRLGEKSGCFVAASSPSSAAVALQNKSGKRRRVETEQQTPLRVASTYLDDTASSPFLGFPRNTSFSFSSNNVCSCSNKIFVEEALEFSYDFSATYLKGKPTSQKPLHYMKPTSANPAGRHFPFPDSPSIF